MRYRISGYTDTGKWTGPEEIEAEDLIDVLTHPKSYELNIVTPVYVETWTEGRWVPND